MSFGCRYEGRGQRSRFQEGEVRLTPQKASTDIPPGFYGFCYQMWIDQMSLLQLYNCFGIGNIDNPLPEGLQVNPLRQPEGLLGLGSD